MDIQPQNLNPAIIAIAQNNPLVREIVELYLNEVPVNDGEPLTWNNTLEMVAIKLDQQYRGALEGWRESNSRPMPTQPALTDGQSR